MSFVSWPFLIAGAAAAFWAGSIPFGFLIGKWNKIDLRQHGSGNIGATNVWRVLGKGWGSLAFLLDFLKGFLPVWGVKLFLAALVSHAAVLSPVPSGMEVEIVLVATALAAVLGHNFTPWLGFKGGKGVATSAGVLAALLPAALGVVLAVWVVFFAVFRIVSVASIVAAAVLPVAVWFLYPHRPVFFGFALVAGAMTIVLHRANIGRLLRGEEKRIGSKTSK